MESGAPLRTRRGPGPARAPCATPCGQAPGRTGLHPLPAPREQVRRGSDLQARAASPNPPRLNVGKGRWHSREIREQVDRGASGAKAES